MPEFQGGCHCGNISVVYTTAIAAEDAVPRACQCSFCRKHWTRALSDPDGILAITVTDAGRLGRYRFAINVAEYLVCATCGVYVSAYMAGGEDAYGIVMANALDDHAAFGPGAPMDYGGEDEAGKRARRRQKWTPATLTIKNE